MKTKELKFIKKVANDRVINKIGIYKNNKIILENKDIYKSLGIDFEKIM